MELDSVPLRSILETHPMIPVDFGYASVLNGKSETGKDCVERKEYKCIRHRST
jgi:hypothetical protein